MNIIFAAALLFIQPAEIVDPRSQLDGMDGAPTQIAILGTPHLSQIGGLERDATGPVLDRLAGWRPDLILIEALPAYQVEVMTSDPAYEDVAEQFAGTAIELAAAAQAATGLSRHAAEAEIAGRLASSATSTPADRRRLAVLFLAAGRPDSAVVQWMYLDTGDQRPGDGMTTELATALTARLAAVNESVAIAARLATRLGLQGVEPFDSHLDKARYLADIAEIGAAFEASQVMAETLGSDAMQAFSAVGGQVDPVDGLLGTYRTMNSPRYGMTDVTLQWASFARADMNGFGRVRLALWESRNLTMAAQARLAMAEHPSGRILIIVGAAHKPFLEDLLSRSMDVEIADMGAILE